MLRTLELAIALNAIPISVKDTMNSFFVELMLESFDAICSTNAPGNWCAFDSSKSITSPSTRMSAVRMELRRTSTTPEVLVC